MITTLLWDIDGVFVDTEKLHFRAWQWLAQMYDKELLWDEYLPMIGQGSEENMDRFREMKGITEDPARLQILRRKKYAELRDDGIPVITENITLARRFKEQYQKIEQAAVSSSRRTDIDENIKAVGLSDFFKIVISFEDRPGLRRKPAPDLYKYACEVLGRSPSECLAFEDSVNGAHAAEAAGIKVLILPTTLSPREILEIYN